MDNVRTTCSLERFPPIPGPGRVTICEVGGVCRNVVCNSLGPVDFGKHLKFPQTYHHIMGSSLKPVVPSKIPSIRVTESADTFIVQTSETWLMGTWNALMDGGVGAAMRFLENEPVVPASVRNTVEGLIHLWQSLYTRSSKLAIRMYPHYGLEQDDLIEKFSTVRSWKTSWIRAIDWHPTSSKLAIALLDDSIRVFTNDVNDGFPYLKCPDQKRVTSLAWKPFTERELAVGVESGVLVWSLDASLKPTANKARVLTAAGHSPITSVQYSSNGRHLLSSSSLDSSIYVWDANSYEPFVLHRYGGGGIPLARWAPNGTRIFSTTPTAAFRIWTAAHEWAPSRWKTAGQPVEAMCWMPDSGMIIFASASYLYTILVLSFEEDFVDTESSGAAIPVYDLRETQIPQEQTGDLFTVGGRVQQLLISPDGRKLAIMFSECNVIALFRIQKKSPDFLFPIGFVRGFENEYPLAMEFQKNLEADSVLTIAWSSTRLQHFPKVDNPSLLTHISPDERPQLYSGGLLNRSTGSLNGSFNADGEGGGDYDNTGSFREDLQQSSPRFKIFSSPNGM